MPVSAMHQLSTTTIVRTTVVFFCVDLAGLKDGKYLGFKRRNLKAGMISGSIVERSLRVRSTNTTYFVRIRYSVK